MKPHFNVGIFDELDALYPDTNAHLGKEIYQISSASNSFASAHLMISDLTPGDCVTFEIIGPHGNYKLFELVPVPVEHNTGLTTRTECIDHMYNPYTIRRAPFMIYEALRPMRNILQATGTSLAVAFRSLVNVCKYTQQKWDILITVGTLTRKVTLIVNAFPVYVPPCGKDSHKYVNWINLDNVAELHYCTPWSDRWLTHVKSYFKLAHYGRQNTAWLQPTLFFEQTKDHTLILNEKKLDKLIEIIDECGLYYIQCATVAGRKDGDWMASEAEVMITGEPIPGPGESTLASIGEQLYTYLVKHNLEERWIQSFFDEPLDVSSTVYKQGVSILKSVMPNIPILDANKSAKPIEGSLTIWCPNVADYEHDLDFYNHRISEGDRVWVYTCLEPTGPYLNRLLDMERIRTVLFGWVASLYDVDGFLHWGGSYFKVNPYEQSCVCMNTEEYTNYHSDYASQLPAGDCGIFYPHYSGAISCTRLEGHRIGFEDLELILLLKKMNPALCDQLVHTLARGYKDYETDLVLYRQTKHTLLSTLNALQTID